jgi:alkylation response protein AidB-like acyl-CoA dehydrogenase
VVSSFVGPACSAACALGLRVHGGIGFTWEHDSHLFLKRAKLDEVLFGSPSWHRRRLADDVFPEVVPR